MSPEALSHTPEFKLPEKALLAPLHLVEFIDSATLSLRHNLSIYRGMGRGKYEQVATILRNSTSDPLPQDVANYCMRIMQHAAERSRERGIYKVTLSGFGGGNYDVRSTHVDLGAIERVEFTRTELARLSKGVIQEAIGKMSELAERANKRTQGEAVDSVVVDCSNMMDTLYVAGTTGTDGCCAESCVKFKTRTIDNSTRIHSDDDIVLIDTRFGLIHIQLPPACHHQGKIFGIKAINAGVTGNDARVYPVNDSLTARLVLDNQSLIVVSNGKNWVIRFKSGHDIPGLECSGIDSELLASTSAIASAAIADELAVRGRASSAILNAIQSVGTAALYSWVGKVAFEKAKDSCGQMEATPILSAEDPKLPKPGELVNQRTIYARSSCPTCNGSGETVGLFAGLRVTCPDCKVV